jgi:GNAT superfamily N-acetyltransferase
MFDLRSPMETDAQGILDLLIASDIAELGHADSDLEDVRWRWRQRTFDVAKDSLVVESDGRIVAYALVHEGLAEVTIDPEHRGRGLGTMIERAVRARARDQGDSPDGMLRQNVTSLNPAGRELLEKLGYRESHHYARMEIEFGSEPTIPPVPEGVTVRAFDLTRDAELLHRA